MAFPSGVPVTAEEVVSMEVETVLTVKAVEVSNNSSRDNRTCYTGTKLNSIRIIRNTLFFSICFSRFNLLLVGVAFLTA